MIDINENIWVPSNSISISDVEFVYTGDPGNDKDRIGLIIDCFYELREMNFLFRIIGITEKNFLEKYPSYKNKLLTMASKICFVGRVSHKRSIEYLYSADYCIFLRNKTRKNMAGFPTKFVECITTGIGIIVNNFSNIKDYFPLKNSVLLESLDKSKLKEIIKSKIQLGKVIHTMSQLFDYTNEVEKMKIFLGKL